MLHNKKGMTLIEILVVLVISSLIMVIAGSLILNSIGYFDKTTSSDVDKRVTDSMASFVRDELIYASNVKISTTKPESNESEWHSISLNEDGYLMKDDEQLYPDEYYNRKNLKIGASVYRNTYRLDLKFSLMEHTEAMYTTSTTLELINIKTKILDSNIEHVEETANTEMVDISTETGNKIYYQKGTLGVTDIGGSVTPDGEQAGTVADESKCKSELNSKEWDSSRKATYKKGTFVEYNGVLYRAMRGITNNTSTPLDNEKGNWKVIDRTFHEQSSYEKDDVVEYPQGSKQYFICVRSYFYDEWTTVSTATTKYWTSIAKEDIDVTKYDTCEEASYIEGTVGAEVDCISDSNTKVWEDYGTTGIYMTYPVGTYIEYPIDSGKYYKAVRNGASNASLPDGDSWLWKKIETDWDSKSSYEYGDIVYDGSTYAEQEGRGKGYYKYINNFTNNTSYPSDKGNYGYWEVISEEDVKKNDACHSSYS